MPSALALIAIAAVALLGCGPAGSSPAGPPAAEVLPGAGDVVPCAELAERPERHVLLPARAEATCQLEEDAGHWRALALWDGGFTDVQPMSPDTRLGAPAGPESLDRWDRYPKGEVGVEIRGGTPAVAAWLEGDEPSASVTWLEPVGDADHVLVQLHVYSGDPREAVEAAEDASFTRP